MDTFNKLLSNMKFLIGGILGYLVKEAKDKIDSQRLAIEKLEKSVKVLEDKLNFVNQNSLVADSSEPYTYLTQASEYLISYGYNALLVGGCVFFGKIVLGTVATRIADSLFNSLITGVSSYTSSTISSYFYNPVTPDTPITNGSPITPYIPITNGSPITPDTTITNGSPIPPDTPITNGSHITPDTPITNGSHITPDNQLSMDNNSMLSEQLPYQELATYILDTAVPLPNFIPVTIKDTDIVDIDAIGPRVSLDDLETFY
jgi:hypothetical protein